MASITLKSLTKSYGTNVVVTRLDLEIADKEFVVLLGPSGCGKSSVLRMIAGLEAITAGEVRIGDRVVNDLEPRERDIAMVFQNYALYPHMTVRQNIAFCLENGRLRRDEIKQRVAEAARVVQMDGLLERLPAELSGGQRQRVAIARAIVRKPKLFLMDEPLSNLDARLRVQMRAELARLRELLEVTTIYVTHDQIEAMTLADRIVVMHEGVVQQVGAPMDVYRRPRNKFVAGFVGSPAMSFVDVDVIEEAGRRLLCAEGVRVELPPRIAERVSGQRACLGLRPQHLRVAALDDAMVTGTVDVVEPYGAETYVSVRAGGALVTARLDATQTPKRGDVCRLTSDPDNLYLFDRETETAID